MKKLVTSVFTLALLLVSVNAFAQVNITDNANLTASAEVIATSISITQDTPLDFGVVSISTTTTQNYNAAGAGILGITGEAAQDAYINVAATSINLTNTGAGSETILFNNFNFGVGTTNDPTGSSLYTLNNATPITGGQIYFFVGGDLVTSDALTNPAGTYEGTLAVEVSYNTF